MKLSSSASRMKKIKKEEKFTVQEDTTTLNVAIPGKEIKGVFSYSVFHFGMLAVGNEEILVFFII